MKDTLSQIRKNNETINMTIQSIIKKYNRNVPNQIIQRILQLEQKNIVATYLAEYGEFIFNKDNILENLGEVQISKTCSSGLNHKTNAVLLSDAQELIDKVIGNDSSKFNENAKMSDVSDMPSYIAYMQEKGGTALEFYLSTLPHEVRHMMGVDGNSAFPTAKGFAEGKNELDTRRAMEKYGIQYFPNRNYSLEVKFVECLEALVGKDAIDELGSFKPLQYAKLAEVYGDVFRQYVELQDRNSPKKDARLYFESIGQDVRQNSPEFEAKKIEIAENNAKEDEAFRESSGLTDEEFDKMKSDYLALNAAREKKRKELFEEKVPVDVRANVQKLAAQFDRIHIIGEEQGQNAMLKAYSEVNLDSLYTYIQQKNLGQVTNETTADETTLQTILVVQEQEINELSKIIEPRINITDVNLIAREPSVAERIVEASNLNDHLLEQPEHQKNADSMEK